MSESLSVFAQVRFLTGGNLALFMSFWSAELDAPPEPTPSHMISAIGHKGLIDAGSNALYSLVSLSYCGTVSMNLTESFNFKATGLLILGSSLA